MTPKRVKIRTNDLDVGSTPVIRYVCPGHLQPLQVPEDLQALSGDVGSLLCAVTHQASPRQLRLFAVGCCRLEWDRFTEERSRVAILAAEEFADDLTEMSELDAARVAAYQARAAREVYKMAADAAKQDAQKAASLVAMVGGNRGTRVELLWDIFGNTPFRGLPRPGERTHSMARDSDIFGNDFRPFVFDPRWSTPAVEEIAVVMYESRDFGAMPILADALEEAGCDLPRILVHCRAGGRHTRGCWVVDLVLGRK